MPSRMFFLLSLSQNQLEYPEQMLELVKIMFILAEILRSLLLQLTFILYSAFLLLFLLFAITLGILLLMKFETVVKN